MVGSEVTDSLCMFLELSHFVLFIITYTCSFSNCSTRMAMSNEHSNQKESSSETTDLTVCGICLSLIDNPKVLPCLHTFCCGCLEKWTNEQFDNVTVPYARKV